jgi:hypothetical protein
LLTEPACAPPQSLRSFAQNRRFRANVAKALLPNEVSTFRPPSAASPAATFITTNMNDIRIMVLPTGIVQRGDASPPNSIRATPWSASISPMPIRTPFPNQAAASIR